jgi:hypothetical protein
MTASGGADRVVLWLALDTSFLWPTLALSGALIVGAVVILLVQRWRKRTLPADDPSGQLAHFRTLYEQGIISQEELNRLRSLLGGQLRQAYEVPPRPSGFPGQAPGPGGTPAGERPGEPGPPETGTRPG